MKKVIVIIVCAWFKLLPAQPSEEIEMAPTFSVSVGNMISNELSIDAYFGSFFVQGASKGELNSGYMFFRGKTQFAEINDLDFNSHGLFLEGNYYLIKGLYLGGRLAMNFNWVEEESQTKFDSVRFDPPTFFLGAAAFGHIGYYQPITENLSLRLQAQVGINHYRISQGWTAYWFSDNFVKSVIGTAFEWEVLSNISVGITCKL